MREKIPTYDNQEMKDAILRLIHSRADRKIMYLKFVDGLTLTEISDETSIPYSTVRDHYYLHKDALLQEMKRKNPE